MALTPKQKFLVPPLLIGVNITYYLYQNVPVPMLDNMAVASGCLVLVKGVVMVEISLCGTDKVFVVGFGLK